MTLPANGSVSRLNGRAARYYKIGTGSSTFYLPVTYHKRIRGKTRPLTISTKLLSQVLRGDA
jgi:hypothetical protein